MALFVAGCGGGGEAGLDVNGAVRGPGDGPAWDAPAANTTAVARTDQLIVRFVADVSQRQFSERAAEFERSLGADTGLALRALRQTRAGSVVLTLPRALPDAEVAQLAARIATREDVAFAEADQRLQPDALPSDSRWSEQWALAAATAAAPAGIDAPAAWVLPSGSAGVVVAVLDTGVLPHADLDGRLLPGHDFVSDPLMGNDGDGRDADATDPGDWIDGSESWAAGLPPRASLWHGTHVAGLIGARGNNGLGVAGVHWGARLLPVRVLGRGGGYLSDIADGLHWAVGAGVEGAPANAHPARVVNMSLGGAGRCSREMQDALDEAHARGALVVVSAGNSADDVSRTTVAGCRWALPVAALGRGGELAAYSNTGAAVALAAPGGHSPADPGILSLGDGGAMRALGDNAYLRKQGTSMAAPHVAGAAAAMLAANPDLSVGQLRELLLRAARPFAAGTARDCDTARCGAGMLDAGAAVSLAVLSPAAPAWVDGARAVPEPGTWLPEGDTGRRVFIDVRAGQPSLVIQFFDVGGRPQWAHARPAWDGVRQAYLGRWTRHRGGSTLDGGSRPARPDQDLGELSLRPDVHAGGTGGDWLLATGGRVLRLSRLVLADAGQEALPSTPPGRTGLWWSVDRLGALFAIDASGPLVRLSALSYTHEGVATWRTVDLARQADGRHAGYWQDGSGGGTLAGPARAAVARTPAEGEVALYWDGGDHARLVLPGGQVLALQAGPESAGAAPRAQSEALLGIWRARYMAGAAWDERWTLAELSPSTLNVGDYNVSGFNQWGGWMLGGWSSRYANHSVYAPGLLLDDFYVLQASADGGWRGCYHYYQLATDRLSDCFPLAVGRQGTAGEAAAAPRLASGTVVGDRGKEAGLLAGTGVAGQPIATVAQAGAGAVPPQAASLAHAQLQGWRQAMAGLR